ncbi:extracellular solute-binding protein [candidate division KSB1 bacterium]|nr:extracellular solute-binding protein [candidate division KSB1 bacterium]
MTHTTKISGSFILVLFIIVQIFLGCGAKKSQEDGVVRLTYWCSSNQFEIELAQTVVREWNSAHPGVQVAFQPIPAGQSSEEVLLAAIVGKTTPDLCSNIWPGSVAQYVEAGVVVAVDTMPGFHEAVELRTPESLVKAYRSRDGHQYQIPWKTNPIMIECNLGLFREAGVESLPKTYSEFYEAAEKLVRDRDGDGYADQWAAYRDVKVDWWQRFFDFYTFYAAATDGKALLDGNRVAFNNAEAVEVFRFWSEGYRKGYLPNARFEGDAFLLEKYAMHITGPWNIAHTEKFKPEGFEYDFIPIPVPDGHKGPVYTYGDQKNIVIFSTTRHPGQAWEFARFLISKENDLKLLELCGQLPQRVSLLKDSTFADYFERNPMMRKFAAQVPYTVAVDNSPYIQEVFDAISQEYDAACIMGVKTPEQGIADAAKRSRTILSRG